MQSEDINGNDSSKKTSRDKFVTVLEVNELTSNDDYGDKQKFVTVLRVENNEGEVEGLKSTSLTEEVTIYRLPGERLGMGLKFEGGCHVSDCVTRLFIQSITAQSPASRARCSWGQLEEGDMIMQIQGRDVVTLTRLDCVSILRDAPVALVILVQHETRRNDNRINSTTLPSPPPPVPVRTRMGIRLSPQIARAFKLSREPNGKANICDGDKRQKRQNSNNNNNSRSADAPVTANLYVDLIAEEETLMKEYESDDTGSSVSTVVDKLTSNNVHCEQERAQSVFDLTRALTPFEQLEEELETEFEFALNGNHCADGNAIREERVAFKENKSESVSPPQMFKDHRAKKEEENRANGNNTNVAVTREGFVNQEKKKLESLIENSPAAPAPMTNTRVKSRVRKPRAPPPPVPSSKDDPPKKAKKPNFAPPPVPPRSKLQRQDATLDSEQEDQVKNDERLQAVQCWLEASLESNKEVGQGEDMRASPVSATRDASDASRAVILDSSDDAADAEISPTDPLPRTESAERREETREMSNGEELLIDFSEDFASKSSRLPPDGHEFPPVFDDSFGGLDDAHPRRDEDQTRRGKKSDSSDENLGSAREPVSRPRRGSTDSSGFRRDDDSPAVSASEMLIELMCFDEETKMKNCGEPYGEVLLPPLIPPPPVPCPDSSVKSPANDHQVPEETKTPTPRKPLKSLLRNVDEKNCMSLREKIAMFSRVDSETSVVDKRSGSRKNSASRISNEREEPAPDGDSDHLEKNDGSLESGVSGNVEKDSVVYRTEWNCGRPQSFGVGSSSFASDGRRNTISDFPKSSHWDKASTAKKSIYSLLESTRQHVSKLKGLVIPEKQNVNGNGSTTGNALPLITSGTDSIRRSGNNWNDLNKFGSLPRNFDYDGRYADLASRTEEADDEGTRLSAPPWRDGEADFPKYSPAFKRKSLSVVRTNPTTLIESRPRSVTEFSDAFALYESRKTSCVNSANAFPPSKNWAAANFKDAVEGEDKDSIVSSSGSNFSTSLSPPISPNGHLCSTDDDIVEEFVVIRIEDKAVSDDVDSRPAEKRKEKVNRTNSVDSLNRRNILEQAKHSRGSTAEIETPENTKEKSVDQVDNKVVETVVEREEMNNTQKKCRHRKSLSDIASVTRLEMSRDELTKPNAGKRFFVEKGDGKVRSFRDIAEQWELRAHDSASSDPPPQARRKSLPANAAPSFVSRDNVRNHIQQHFRNDRSYSVTAVVELRGDKSKEGAGGNASAKKNGYFSTPDRKEPSVNGKRQQLQSSSSISDLLKVFEQPVQPICNGSASKGKITNEAAIAKREPTMRPHHSHMSSQDSTASESDALSSTHYGSVNSLTSIAHDQYGSITSLASSTSLISAQELQQLLDEANQSLEESGTPLHEIIVVVLHREIAGGSIGITLAGGADYEAKEITVHKIICGSLADRDGRIQKGDRVLSINGKNVKGITHKEALNILKAPRPECVLVLSRNTSSPSEESNRKSLTHDTSQPVKPRKKSNRAIFTVELAKDAAGLGFSLEGGKDSPAGDKPLVIKKIFLGGSAEKSGVLKIGDEIMSVNGVDVTNMPRIEAWNLIKKQPSGVTSVVVRPL